MREPTGKTPVIFQEITFDRKGSAHHRFSRTCLACGARTAGYRPLLQKSVGTIREVMPPASVFYFDRVARSNLEVAIRVKQAGGLVVFEPSGIKDPKLFEACLRTCHIFKYSNDRLSAVRDASCDAKVPVEIETRGKDGLLVLVRHESTIVHEEELPALPAPMVRDASGSGDWCSAGLIHALLSGRRRFPNFIRSRRSLVRALRWGQAFAALNCCYEGCSRAYVCHAEGFGFRGTL